jgi:hypothetical protein
LKKQNHKNTQELGGKIPSGLTNKKAANKIGGGFFYEVFVQKVNRLRVQRIGLD